MASIQISGISNSMNGNGRGALEDFKRFTKTLEKNVDELKSKVAKETGRTSKKGLKS